MKRTGLPPRPRNTGPSAAVVQLVVQRDGNRCAWCGHGISGERGFDWSVHHRRPRGAGGDRRPETNLPSNLVLLHGHGTNGCHGDVESRRADAQGRRFLIGKEWVGVPSWYAIEHAFHGWCYLLDDGSISSHPPAGVS